MQSELIRQATSPATGMHDAEVARLSAKFSYADRTQELGISKLHAWLHANGETVTEGVLRAVHTEWLREGLATESNRIDSQIPTDSDAK
jgi:hypothetical protein